MDTDGAEAATHPTAVCGSYPADIGPVKSGSEGSESGQRLSGRQWVRRREGGQRGAACPPGSDAMKMLRTKMNRSHRATEEQYDNQPINATARGSKQFQNRGKHMLFLLITEYQMVAKAGRAGISVLTPDSTLSPDSARHQTLSRSISAQSHDTKG